MKHTVSVKLENPAKSKGGDKYEGDIDKDNRLVIYVPQVISRADGGVPALNMDVTFESK